MVNKGYSPRNEYPELKRPALQYISTFNKTTANDPFPCEYRLPKMTSEWPAIKLSLLKKFCLTYVIQTS